MSGKTRAGALAAVCGVIGGVLVPGAVVTTASAATSEEDVRDDAGDKVALAHFNSGLHGFHHGTSNTGVNSFDVLDWCNDGLVAWDDGSESEFEAEDGTCDVGHVFEHAGMYTVDITVTDDDGGSDSASVMVVVYDPRAGLLTGAGTLDDAVFATVAKHPAASSTRPLGSVVLEVPTAVSRSGPRRSPRSPAHWGW